MSKNEHQVRTVIYPNSFERKIGFDGVRRMIDEYCTSSLSKELVAKMQFSADYDSILQMLEEVHEMMQARTVDNPLTLDTVEDTTPWLTRIRAAGSFMDTNELSMLRRSLATAAAVRSFFQRNTDSESGRCRFTRLAEAAKSIEASRPVLDAINAVLTEHGEIKDNASPELHDIRAQISRISGNIASVMRRVLNNAIRDGILDADTTPTLRDGRPVIPVPPMHKRRINGIVHDESATGKTYFIEPAEVVELNNRQRELEMEERRETIRILIHIADNIRPYIGSLITTCHAIAYLDFVMAKARFAENAEGYMPHLHKKPQLEWYTARHPILQAALARQNRHITPLDIHLSEKDRILVISGPNAGGKSVTLKTVGIIQYMTQCGILPTCYENSHIGIFTTLLADIGDDQSIEDDLSTYSSHLRNMKFFLAHASKDSLILIDEFGSGTEPQIGGAIAQALLADFNKQGSWGVITTHYQNLKTLADELDGLVNGSMLYDRNLMQPLFKLAIGHPGSSFAMEIARKTGLPDSIIDSAKEIVGSDYVNLDKYLLDIARDRRYWENKRDNIRRREKHLEEIIQRYENDAENLRANRRAIIEDARSEAHEIIASSNAAIERTIHEIRKAGAEREATAEARRRLTDKCQSLAEELKNDSNAPEILKKAPKPKRKKRPKPEESVKETINVGDNVLLDGQGQPGTIMELDGRKAIVAFGMLKLSVEVARLNKTLKKAATGQKAASFVSATTTNEMRQRQLEFKNELDVRGMRADEALQAVTYFIDDAIQFNMSRVRILHGTGTGALRTVIRQYLDTVSAVSSYADEDVRFGGAGITVVNL